VVDVDDEFLDTQDEGLDLLEDITTVLAHDTAQEDSQATQPVRPRTGKRQSTTEPPTVVSFIPWKLEYA
jgi:hypothetical protein